MDDGGSAARWWRRSTLPTRRLLSLSPSLPYLSQMDVPHSLLFVAAAMRPLRSRNAQRGVEDGPALFALRLVGHIKFTVNDFWLQRPFFIS